MRPVQSIGYRFYLIGDYAKFDVLLKYLCNRLNRSDESPGIVGEPTGAVRMAIHNRTDAAAVTLKKPRFQSHT